MKEARRKYTDHKAVLASFRLERQQGVKFGPLPPIVVKNEEGHIKFYEMTDNLADVAVDLLNGGDDILKVFKIIMRKLHPRK